MSQVTEQSVRFQTALASIKLIQASAVLDLTEDDFDFLTSNKVWIATDRSRARRCVEACVYGTLDFVGYPRFPAPVEFIAAVRSEERFSRNAETDLVCRLLLEKKNTQRFWIKPMNCPGHIKVFQSKIHSYRDLPLRIGELGTVYRYERGGALHGMQRVRGFTQDDSHIFCSWEQAQKEIGKVFDLDMELLRLFVYTDPVIYLSTRPETRLGTDEI